MRKCKRLLVALFSLCLCIGIVGVGVQANQVASATTAISLEMHGASVRTVDPDGLRFLSSIPKEFKDSGSFGTLVIPKAILGDDVLNHNLDDVDNVQVDYVDIEQTLWATQAVKELPNFDFDENREYFNAVLVNIPNTDYGTEIVACAYALIDGEYYYAEPMTRSIAYVASAGLANGEVGDKLVQFVDGVTDENSLVIDATELTIVEGKTADIGVTVNPSYLIPVYASDNNEVATVKDGVVTAVKVGTANITVTLGSIVKTIEVTVEEPVVADAEDANVLSHLYASGTPAFGAGLYNTSAEVIAYEDSDLTKPDDVEGETLVKYTLTSTDTNASGKLINSMPLRYESGGAYKFNEQEASIDFSKAVLSFYIYSPVAVKAILTHTPDGYFNTSNMASVNVPAGQWTKVEFNLYGYILDKGELTEREFIIDPANSYLFAVGVFADRMQYEEVTYYIDNVTIAKKQLDPNGLTAIQEVIEENGSYAFDTAVIGADANGVAWIKADNKEENIEKGKNYLQVTVNFTEFSTVSARFTYSAGADNYKFSFGYKHDITTVFAYNNYAGANKTILGSTRSAAAHNDYKSGLKVYDGELCVINHGSSAWSYYSTVENYASANGNLSTGKDYVFEYDLTKCTGELLLNFGSKSTIKDIKWVETSGVVIEPVTPTETNTLSYAEYAVANNGSYDFNATNIPAEANGVSWLKVDNKDAKITEGKTKLKVTVNFIEFGTIGVGSVHSGQGGTYKFSFGIRHGGAYTTWADAQHATYGCILGTAKDNGAVGNAFKAGLKVYSGSLLLINHTGGWSYSSTTGAGHTSSANKTKLSTGVDYVFEIDVTNNCAGELLLNFGASSIIKGVEWA